VNGHQLTVAVNNKKAGPYFGDDIGIAVLYGWLIVYHMLAGFAIILDNELIG
jgi:hypothetical protein